MAKLETYKPVLDEFGARVIKRAQANLRKKRTIRGRSVNRVYRGNLLAALTWGYFKRGPQILQWFGVKPNDPTRNYADVIEKGRRPNNDPKTWPPVSPIYDWMKAKSLFKSDNQKTKLWEAARMARRIGTRGIVGIDYMRDAFQDEFRKSGKEFRLFYRNEIFKQARLKADKYIK